MKDDLLINRVCERFSLSRDELARHLGRHVRGVYGWLRGEYKMDDHIRTRLVQSLEAVGTGFCEDAALSFCLRRESLKVINSHLRNCPRCQSVGLE